MTAQAQRTAQPLTLHLADPGPRIPDPAHGEPKANRALRLSLAENSRALDLLHRYMTAAQRDFDRALKRFHEVEAHRRAEERRDIVEAPLSPQGYKSKWGLDPDFAIISYCGRLTDVLPNEPELAGILTAAVAPFTSKPKRTTAATTKETA